MQVIDQGSEVPSSQVSMSAMSETNILEPTVTKNHKHKGKGKKSKRIEDLLDKSEEIFHQKKILKETQEKLVTEKCVREEDEHRYKLLIYQEELALA